MVNTLAFHPCSLSSIIRDSTRDGLGRHTVREVAVYLRHPSEKDHKKEGPR